MCPSHRCQVRSYLLCVWLVGVLSGEKEPDIDVNKRKNSIQMVDKAIYVSIYGKLMMLISKIITIFLGKIKFLCFTGQKE